MWSKLSLIIGHPHRSTKEGTRSGETAQILLRDVVGWDPGELYHFPVVAQSDTGVRTTSHKEGAHGYGDGVGS